jgi:hypothetical protein
VVEVDEDGGTVLPVALDPDPVEPPVDDPVEPVDEPVEPPVDELLEPPVELLEPPVEPEGGGSWYPAEDEVVPACGPAVRFPIHMQMRPTTPAATTSCHVCQERASFMRSEPGGGTPALPVERGGLSLPYVTLSPG